MKHPYRVLINTHQQGAEYVKPYFVTIPAADSPEHASALATQELGVPLSAAVSSLPCNLPPAHRVRPGKPGPGTTGFYDSENNWHCTGSRMGRPFSPPQPSPARFYLRREYLNSGGYDRGGAYFGIGAPLYFAQSEDGELETHLRASCRESAKAAVAKQFPGARFFA